MARRYAASQSWPSPRWRQVRTYMLRIVLVRPGCTAFDQQGRIKGTLDIPLSEDGSHQAVETAQQLSAFQFDTVYSAPCRSAQQTAATISATRKLKVKVLEELHNVDHGL